MPLSGLPTQLVQIPLAAGLNQRLDERAKTPPSLDIARDIQFDELGGIQTRHPYDTAFPLATTTGGTIAAADLRRVGDNNGELVLFTKSNLYSWIPTASQWVNRGDHLAVALDEETVFASNGDQSAGDRCELGGVQFYAWCEGANTFVSARDSATKAVYINAFQLTSCTRPRFVVLDTFIYFFVVSGVQLIARTLDPANVISSIQGAGTAVVGSGFNTYYDATRVPGQVMAVIAYRQTPTTSYGVLTIGANIATRVSATKARTCDGPIGVAVTTAGTQVQIVRSNVANVVGDLLTLSTLADVRTNDAIGAVSGGDTPQQIAACFPASVSSPERCDVYYAGTLVYCRKNTITTAGTIGTDAYFNSPMFLGSRAFTRTADAHTYIWGAIDAGDAGTFGLIQGQYIMFRNDGFLVARSRIGNVEPLGFTGSFVGYLSSVQPTATSDEYAFLGAYKRIITNPGALFHPAFTARAPLDVVATFDSNEARRGVRFGKALYISGSPVLQYDGVALSEVNFSLGPSDANMADVTDTTGLDAGSYSWKNTLRSINAQGEVDRSSSYGTRSNIAITLNHRATQGTNGANAMIATRKANIAYEFWRTSVNPTLDTPFYLVSSNDPTAANPNGYIPDTVATTPYFVAAFVDALKDSAIVNNEQHPESDGSLASIPPPPARVIAATNTRIFLGDIAGLPNTVVYSKARVDGLAAAFNGRLTIDVPAPGGTITAISFLNETVIVFRQTAVYAFAGQGLDNTGGGSNYADAHVITTDVGALNQESLVTTDSGIVFKSQKGWHVLDRSLSVQYIGDKVTSFDGETIQSAHLVPGQHQLRVMTSSRAVVFDNVASQWCEWTIADAIGGCIWQGQHLYLSSTTGVRAQRTDYTGVAYGLDVETAWIKFADIQGFARVKRYLITGEYESIHHLRIRLAYNYKYDGAGNPVYVDDQYWTPFPTTVGSVLQVQVSPSIQQVESVKIRITASSTSDNGTPPTAGASLKLTGLGMEVGIKRGLYKLLDAAQKR